MKNVFIYSWVAVLAMSSAVASSQEVQWSEVGFEEPESVLAHPVKPEMYVANIKGHPLEVDGQGYISLISPTGQSIKKNWVEGLDAPKGMGIFGDRLYVADLKKLRIIDHNRGVLLQSIEIHDSVMLNDIAISPTGVVYVSDFLGGGIYRLNNNVLDKWLSAETFPHPNGLYFDQGSLLVATWGEGIQEDFSTTVLGSLYRVDIETGEVTSLKNATAFGNLDGITRIGDRLLINDWINGNVYQYRNDELSLVFNAGKHAADISSRGSELLVPMMFNARIDSYVLAE